MRSALPQLPEAERRVAQALLTTPDGIVRDSVGRLAERAETSPATVVRLSRRLGYEGFAALKIAMAHEAGRGDQFGGPVGDAEGPLHRRVMGADALSIQRSAQVLDPSAMAQASEAIARAGEVQFAGVGASAALAALATFQFAALGTRASSSPEALSQHLRAGTLRPGDVCVAISHTGESRDTVEIAASAREAGASTIGITSFAGSPLTEAVDISLICVDEDDTTRQELFANPIGIVSVIGALHASVALLLPPSSAPANAARLIASHQY